MITWLADVLRAEGLDVYEMPGWETRQTRAGFNLQGVVWHHTATSTAWQDGHVAALLRDGRRDLAGPLSQTGLERDGTWVLVAAGRANHNGYGLWGNDSIGVEAYNDGVGEPWPRAQLDSYHRGTAAICRHLGWDPAARVRAHRETDPGRKIDPTGIDMDAARRLLATLTQGASMADALTRTTLGYILADLLGWSSTQRQAWLKNADGKPKIPTLDSIVRAAVRAEVANLPAGGGGGLSAAQVRAEVKRALKEGVG